MKDARSTENNVVRILGVIFFLMLAFFGSRIFAKGYASKLTQELTGQDMIRIQIKEEIISENDAYELCKIGISMDKANEKDLALAAFVRATDLDKKYRDAWVLRGNLELKNDRPEEAITSLKKAEELDPIYPRTYELLATAYTAVGDEEQAKKAQEKWEYLKKTAE